MIKKEYQELVNLYNIWISDGKKYLTNILGYAEFLLTGKSGELSENQRQAIKEIHHNGMFVFDCWHSNFMKIHHPKREGLEDIDAEEKLEVKEHPNKFIEMFLNAKDRAISNLIQTIEIVESLLEDGDELTQVQIDFIEKIRKDARKEMDCWIYPADFLKLRFGLEEAKFSAGDLSQIVEESLETLIGTFSDKMDIQISHDLPEITRNQWLRKVFEIIFKHLRWGEYGTETSPIIVTAAQETEKVVVKIQSNQPIPEDVSDDPSNLFCCEMGYAVIDFIIKQHSSQLLVSPLEPGLEFKFELSVWKK
jgi:hypothetical protein